MSTLIDTHCHLHDAEAFPNPDEELRLAREAGVESLIVVGVQPVDWERAIQMAEAFDEVSAIIGWHPNYTADYSPESLDRLKELLAHPKVRAMGEIGLDYHWDYAPRELQFQALRDGLSLAKEIDVPVVFHAREAYEDLLDVLEGFLPLRTLFHCYVGSAAQAKRAAAMGAYFGVDGPISYKKNDELRAMIAELPRDRVVLETDSPYMAPVPYRGKPNRPAYVANVNAALASVWSVSPEESAAITTSNAKRFFGL
jgi:TatD DNase family protein